MPELATAVYILGVKGDEANEWRAVTCGRDSACGLE